MGLPLVICYGNLARGDDGVAHRVAGALAGQPGMRVLALPLLDVSLAEDLAAAPLVVFVDAERRDTPLVRVESLTARPDDSASVHGLTPRGLLALTGALFGRSPEAHLVVLAAPEMGHGETLSGTAEAASGEAASVVSRLCGAGS